MSAINEKEKAIGAVQSNILSLRDAESTYGIPKSTIHNYTSGKTMVGATRGPSTVLTTEEEQKLAEWAIKMAEIGYGQTRRQVCEMVKKIMDNTKRPNPFTENRPGRDWWYGFLRRHPQLSMRQPQGLQEARAACCTPAVLDKWFVDFEQFLLKYDLHDKPYRIWNCDESGFSLCPKSGKVVAPKGAKDVYSVTGNNKQQVTTLCAIGAAGGIIPPMHVYPGERFAYNPLEGGVEGAYLGKSQNGWMTQELFFGWISRHFATKIPSDRPVCLLVDGHSSHIDLDVSNFCQQDGILLYCLPPHTSHVLQPLDVGFFSPLKLSWKVAATEYQQTEGRAVNKQSFAKVFRSAYLRVVKLSTIVNAFRACGIYPVNRNAIKPKKLQPSLVYQSSEHVATTSSAENTQACIGIGASKLALQALEAELDQSTLDCFSKRYEEGYDLKDDRLYTTWQKLKRKVEPQEASSVPSSAGLQTTKPSSSALNPTAQVIS